MDEVNEHALMSLDELQAWLAEFLSGSNRLQVKEVRAGQVVCEIGPDGLEFRPGGTIAGPAIFWAVDISSFLAVNARVGRVPSAVLAQSSMSFLEAADPGVLEIVAQVVKLGSRSAVVDARVTDDRGRLIAVATLHFALPTRRTPRVAQPSALGEGTT